jgi:hypothetical protein
MACGQLPTALAGPSWRGDLKTGLTPHPVLCKHQWRILHALLVCRTPALGGHRYHCQDCGRTTFVPHSCRNRHCPNCQGAAARNWLAKRPHFCPYGIPPGVPRYRMTSTLIQQNQRALYTLLFQPPARRCWSLARTDSVFNWG